jgi:hypothetical protein
VAGLSEPTLFEVPDDAWVIPPPKEELTRGERRKRLVDTRIANGVHPLGRPVLLHPDASRDPENRTDGPRCGGCVFRQQVRYHDRTWPKCWYPDVDEFPHPRDTHCESSDIRKWWPACRDYQPKEDADEPVHPV